MNFSKEVNRTDENFEHNSTQINREEINKNAIEDHLYDVNEIVDESNDSKHERRFSMPIDTHEIYKPMENNNDADSGDVINCRKNNFEHLQSSSKSQLDSLLKHDGLVELYSTPEDSLTINRHQHSNIDGNETTIKFHPHLKTKYSFITEHPLDEKENINNEQKILDPISSLSMCHLSVFHFEHCTTSTCLMLPQLVQNQDYSVSCFQQLWSSQVHLTNLKKFNTSGNTLSVLWTFISLISKLIMTGLHSCVNILRYDILLLGFCYFLGVLFGMNAYFFIDFLLIVTCIISILVVTYEKWLFHYGDLNEYDNVNNESQYWRRIQLAIYGLVIGTISTYII
jgi:hypothetical protein